MYSYPPYTINACTWPRFVVSSLCFLVVLPSLGIVMWRVDIARSMWPYKNKTYQFSVRIQPPTSSSVCRTFNERHAPTSLPLPGRRFLKRPFVLWQSLSLMDLLLHLDAPFWFVAQVGLLTLLLTLVVLAVVKAAVVVVPDQETSIPTDGPSERTFGLIGLVASIWAVLRRTMGWPPPLAICFFNAYTVILQKKQKTKRTCSNPSALPWNANKQSFYLWMCQMDIRAAVGTWMRVDLYRFCYTHSWIYFLHFAKGGDPWRDAHINWHSPQENETSCALGLGEVCMPNRGSTDRPKMNPPIRVMVSSHVKQTIYLCVTIFKDRFF